ncbi:MAG TPA: energy transducer TonB [Longimicrobiaceae bacterium]|nr:energy transducer TonB [Longimicrobiaceae bacterium]
MRSHPLGFIALALLLLGGTTAAAQERRPLGISEAVDSAGLVAKLGALPALPTGKRAVINVYFSNSGEPDSVGVMTESRVSPEVRPGLLEAVRSSLRMLPADTADRGIMLALTTGSRAVLTRPTESPPQVTNTSSINRLIDDFSRKHRAELSGETRTAMLKFLINTEGRAEQAEILRSSGLSAVDAEAVRIAGLFRFRPGMFEGHSVPVLVTMPITFGP